MKYCYADCETRSEADLKKVGARLYAEHPTTDILCWQFTNPEHNDCLMLLDHVCDEELRCPTCEILESLALDPEVFFVFHNAGFEQAIWGEIMVDRYGFPPIPLERIRCTMAKAVAHGLPASLAAAGAALNLPIQKDEKGHRVMMKLSRPRRPSKSNPERFWTPQTAPDDFSILYNYCGVDVLSTKLLDRSVRDLSAYEQQVWLLDQRMNQRGVRLDLPTINAAIELIKEHERRVNAKFLKLTGVMPTQRAKVQEWLRKNECLVTDLQAPTVDLLLRTARGKIRDCLLLYAEANKTSLAKYPQMVARANSLGLSRENLAYHSAHTGRWAGRGIQFQNLPRPAYKIPTIVEAIQSLGYECFKMVYGNVSVALSSAIRGMVIPEDGHYLIVGDFASIEAVVLPWLAGQQMTLDLFRETGDLYCAAASGIYGRVITKADKNERFIGKVSVLSLGYAGGIGAFAKMAGQYGLDIKPIAAGIWATATHDEREAAERSYLLYCKRTELADQVSKTEAFIADIIKQRFRAANPEIEAYWYELERCSMEAVRTGKPVQCGRVRWFTSGGFLYCKLPSGRCMAYPQPKLTIGSRGKTVLSYQSADTRKGFRGRVGVYGGMLAENITQAVSRDLLVAAMLRCEEHGYTMLLTIHDELVLQAPNGFGSAEEVQALMEKLEPWAEGIPVKAEVWSGARYGK